MQAAFSRDNSLVVTRTGNGDGRVVSVPAGIDCGTDCNEVYAEGTTVTLTATPMAGLRFIGVDHPHASPSEQTGDPIAARALADHWHAPAT